MSEPVAGLEPYVPRVASDWDTDEPGSLARAIDGTLVFVDISGFTNLSERLARRGRIGAEELTSVLNRVFGQMLEVVFARGGSLLKFGGDALLLFFSSEDHVMQATAATVEMRRTLRDASREKTSVGRINLRMSSGIHTGPVDFFLVGGSHRELIVSGPVASVTTEMEGTADASEIVVSEAVRDLLPDSFTGAAKGRGWLLRKMQIPHPPTGPIERDSSAGEDLGQFVPIGLRDHLRLGLSDSEHRIATIGFLKFSGIDDMMAASGRERVGAALDGLIRSVQEAIAVEDVTFMASDIDANGGKVILTSGVPFSQHDDEGRMLRAARRIIEDEGHGLAIRLGLNRGHVFAGNVGAKFRRTYTVMGDTVNLAARLMATADKGHIYSSPSVLDHASTLLRTEALEPFFVKGKEQPVQAYDVFSEIGVRPPDLGYELPFHGREAELDMIVSIVTTCARVGRGGMMTITGDTGVGKSRLIAEVLERCPGLATLMIKAEPNGSNNPYWAFRDPVRRLLGLERGEPAKMARDLTRQVKKLAPHLLPVLPLLGDIAHIAVEDNEETASIDPRFRPDRTADALIDLLGAIYDEPFAALAEDGQWLDAASRGLLERIGQAAASRPWTVIVTARLGDESFELLGNEIKLAPLDDASIRAIAIEVTAGAPLRPHELQAIVDRAGGNPLFLGEILKVIRETGRADQLPESLDAVVSTEIDTLPPLVRQLLRYLSVLGTSFNRTVLNAYLAPDDISLDQATQEELAKFIVADGDSRLRFRHAVVHDVAYEGLSYQRRRQLHERAGEVIEGLSSDDPNSSAELLAYHFAESGVYEKAWHYSRVAADRAKQAYANTEADTHYRRALEAAGHLDVVDPSEVAEVWTRLGEVRDMTGQYERAREAFGRALRMSRDDPVRAADLYLRRAETWMGTGNLSMAKRNITKGLNIANSHGSRAQQRSLARLLAYESSVHAASGAPVKALDAAERAISLAEQSGEREALARAYGVCDWASFVMGTDRPRSGPEAIEIFEDLGLLERSVGVMNNMGAFAYLEGNWDEAIEWYQRSLETAERSGNVFEAALTKVNIAEVLVSQRKLNEAAPLIDEARRVYRASNAAHYMPLVDLQAARLTLESGEVDSAIEMLESLTSEMGASDSSWIADAEATLAIALARNGRFEEALVVLGKTGEDDARSRRIRALVHAGRDESAQAFAELDMAVSTAEATNDLLEEALAREARQLLSGRVGTEPDPTDAARVTELFETLGIVVAETVSI